MEKNILIIEDDKDIREGVKILLEGEGYSVEEASNGADGLKKLTSHTNLVILDIMMPGISGLKTCEEIRKISYVPILFLTAKSKESDKLIGHFDVGGVRQQRQNALTAKLTKASQVDDTAFNRGVVYLKVAGLYDNASRSVDSKCAGIGNRVVDADKFHRHTACLDGVSGFDLHHLDLIAQSMLLELIFDKT